MSDEDSIWRRPPFDWFAISGPVARRPYFAVGLGLAALKYMIEFAVVYGFTGDFFSPFDFVNPWLNSKAPFIQEAPGLGTVWLLFTVPFVWVAITMSMRRAADIGISPWVGLLVLVPLLNVAAMLLLAAIRTNAFLERDDELAAHVEKTRQIADVYRPSSGLIDSPSEQLSFAPPPFFQRLGFAILVGCATQVVAGAVSVWVFAAYGFILFFASPVVAGTTAGFTYSGGVVRPMSHVFGMTLIMNVVSFLTMLCIGLDGAICLIMAFPLLCPLCVVGSLIGAALASANLRPGRDERRGMIGTMVILPLCLLLEPFDDQKPIHAVTTSVEIAAPPEVVWEQVIAFPEITDKMPWLFRLGIAAPLRARIEGQGVGAIRHCEFTTGSFVEPIRVWDRPRRLAFDVTSQPYPMKEWTPIPHLHPPHLEDGIEVPARRVST